MSERSKARHVQRVAREAGLDDSYERILMLLREHGTEVAKHKHQAGVSWNDAAVIVICRHLELKERV